jgi:hypothetical protein
VLGWAASPECGGVRTTVFWRMAPGDVPLIQRHVRSNATNIVRNSDGLWKIFGYRTSNAVRQGRCNDRSPSKPRIISFRVGQYSVLIVPTHMAIRFVQDRVKVRHLARPPSVCTGPSHLCFFFFFFVKHHGHLARLAGNYEPMKLQCASLTKRARSTHGCRAALRLEGRGWHGYVATAHSPFP